MPPGRTGALVKTLFGLTAVVALVLYASRFLHVSASQFSLSVRSYKGSPSLDGQTQLANPFLPSSFLTEYASGGGEPKAHPIVRFLVDAQKKWHKTRRSQSRSFERASRVYRERYGIAPPPGFKKWLTFAVRGRNHTLVDEYGSMMKDIEPFRKVPAHVLRSRTRELARVPGVSMLTIKKGQVTVQSRYGKWATATALKEMIRPFARDLPDMEIAVNEFSGGRILPQQTLDVDLSAFTDVNNELATLLQSKNATLPEKPLEYVKPSWGDDGTLWEAVQRSCDVTSPSRRLVSSIRSVEVFTSKPNTLPVPGRDSSQAVSSSRLRQNTKAYPPLRELAFNEDLDYHSDICRTPSIHNLHSAYFSDTRSIPGLYPLFSSSKASGFSDLLIPGVQHWSPVSDNEYETDLRHGRSSVPTDRPFSEKNDTLFWRGQMSQRHFTMDLSAPTGPSASFQKQRLVKMLNDATMQERILVAYDYASGSLISASTSTSFINALVADVAFACDSRLNECRQFRSLGYRTDNPKPLENWWRHKYVLDIDDDGASPLFFALMDSNSAVVKSSIQHEFWQDWIVPWFHYIPLSSSFFEIYNIQAFFSGFPKQFASSSIFNPNVLTVPSRRPETPVTSDGSEFTPAKGLEDIAQAGQEWRKRYARKEDMEVYVYRLLLEWARLLEDPAQTESVAS